MSSWARYESEFSTWPININYLDVGRSKSRVRGPTVSYLLAILPPYIYIYIIKNEEGKQTSEQCSAAHDSEGIREAIS